MVGVYYFMIYFMEKEKMVDLEVILGGDSISTDLLNPNISATASLTLLVLKIIFLLLYIFGPSTPF